MYYKREIVNYKRGNCALKSIYFAAAARGQRVHHRTVQNTPQRVRTIISNAKVIIFDEHCYHFNAEFINFNSNRSTKSALLNTKASFSGAILHFLCIVKFKTLHKQCARSFEIQNSLIEMQTSSV